MVIQGVKYLSDFEAKKAMIQVSKRLDDKGYAIGGDGSLSVRVGPNAVWITITGADKGALTQDMMIRVDMNGKQMMSANPKQLPEDLPLHLKIYTENDKVQCIMHAYPPMINAMGICGKEIEGAGFSPSVRSLGNIHVMNALNIDAAIGKVAVLCKSENGVLLKNDGCIFWGADVMVAFHRVEAAEYYAKVVASLEKHVSAENADFQVERTEQMPAMEHHLAGVTPIIRPGDCVKPVVQSVLVNQMANIPVIPENHNQEESTKVLVKDIERERVMQEVVRRTLKNFNK